MAKKKRKTVADIVDAIADLSLRYTEMKYHVQLLENQRGIDQTNMSATMHNIESTRRELYDLRRNIQND